MNPSADCEGWQTGWLLDLFAKGPAMVLWFVADDGTRVRAEDRAFSPAVFLEGSGAELSACARAVEQAGDAVAEGWTERRDFWTGTPRRLFALRVRRVQEWPRRLAEYARRFPRLAWSNADLPLEQVYCYEHDTFPLARCRFAVRDGELLGLATDDDCWAPDYEPPPLRTAHLEARGLLLGPRPRLEALTLRTDEQTWTWDEPACLLDAFQATLDRLDPDVLLTRGGDAFDLPLLLATAQRARFPLRLDREPPPRERVVRTDGRSFFSYGRILYQPPEYPLHGRWHLDLENSFMAGQAGLEGVFEVTRLSRIPPQRIARRSIGTGITSVQLDLAWREGFAIPWKKTHPEAWKSARQLLRCDRGGLVYAPDTGFHENVVELDFVSMYPSIMAQFNVSPETVNCACCTNGAVPEIGYTLCERRAGLVSRALEPIIAKRVRYKELRGAARAAGDAEAAARFDNRQSALKWMLVCCFGYLGYRNARFGRIEAHEAVSAFSRELLLRARELCEADGWRVLHANVDSVWIAKPGFAREELEPLCRRIDAATGLTIALEGIYRWIAFLPSRQFADRPVPTRYFGAFEDGSIKFRGIECRRRDLPRFVRATQRRLLDRLAAAPDRAAYRAMIPDILADIADCEARLWRHEVPLDDLAMHGAMSREPDEYRGNSPQALAARQSVAAGLNLHAGQSLDYVIADARNADRDRRVRLVALADADTACDPAAYVRLLRRAMNTLLWPANVVLDEAHIPPPGTAPPHRKAPARHRQLDMLGHG
ncbi:MAG: hypothetical protein KF858_17130 [Candidatus Sumerlaeia bacterium]|nr:hypothetical protein [Candidatus Sumerlaeia bacterium]